MILGSGLLQAGAILPPAGFDGIGINFNVRKSGSDYTVAGIDFDDYIALVSGTTKYVATNGSDSNAGTEAAPYGSVYKALFEGASIVYIKPGTYYRNVTVGGGLKGFSITGDVMLARWPGETGDVLLTTAEKITTWTNDATYTNTYTATRSATYAVVDMSQIDSDGGFVRLEKVADQTTCNTTANSWYIDGANKVYVRTVNDRAPDSDILVIVAESNFAATGDLNVVLDNVQLIGGGSCAIVQNAGAGQNSNVYARNTVFAYSYNSNGLSAESCEAVLLNCTAYRNNRDGFNYHAQNGVECAVLESGCLAYSNGLDDANDNNQGSTIHESGRIVRVGGTYKGNKGACVADIETTETWMVGCTCTDSASAGAGNDIGILVATGWIDSCIATGNAADLYGSTNLYHRNTTYTTSGGTVSAY